MSMLTDRPVRGDFEVHLDVYAGPFDVLLGLISKHQLDVTEVALARVTDEFVAFVRDGGFDLDQATSFLVVAATLLDLKAARLLPGNNTPDTEDLALLEARDLLFARLLQYRAFKRVAEWLASGIAAESCWLGRDVTLADEFAALLPRVVLGTDADGIASIAAAALVPRVPEVIEIDHIHAPRVSVHDAIASVSDTLIAVGTASFRDLCRDCSSLLEVIACFLALLELFRDGRVEFEQERSFAGLRVRWAAQAADSSMRARDSAGRSDAPPRSLGMTAQ